MIEKTPYRVIVAGTRSFRNYALLCASCDKYLSQKSQLHSIVIVSGAARGADRMGEQYAHERGYLIRQYPADWNNLGKAAGIIRNAEMADNADALIAFWDGKSRGTAHMINTAKKRKLPIRIVMF